MRSQTFLRSRSARKGHLREVDNRLLILVSCGFPWETLKIKNIDDVYRGGEYGAIELSRLEISEATDDEMAKYVGILSSCSLPKRAYGCVSPFGWNAYVSQDAVSSWKGSGLAAYALWS